MNNIEYKVQNFIKENNLLDNINTIYVATSGGADSMALLMLCEKNLSQKVVAVHVNHGIRGESANRDEMFVRTFCQHNGIECIVFNAINDGITIPQHASEEWARNLRYGYFQKLDMNKAVIATAHTMSDNAETLLFRMSRGTGLTGISGIPIKRDNFIRPFLCLTRKETEKLCEYYNIDYVTDETNLSDDYNRNKIRHNVIPTLKSINPNVEFALASLSTRVDRVNNYICQVARKTLRQCQVPNTHWYYTNGFLGQEDVVQEQMIIEFLSENQLLKESYVHLVQKAITSLVFNTDTEKGEVILDRIAVFHNQNILITSRYISIESVVLDQPLFVGSNEFGSWGHGFKIEPIAKEEFEVLSQNKTNLAFLVDGDKLNFSNCYVRNRQPGDKFKPAKKTEGRILNFLSQYGLHERNELPLIVCNNKIICVYGVGFTDGFAPTKESRSIYQISFW